MNKINLTRLEELIHGSQPESKEERIFLRCYVGTILNETLMSIMLDLKDQVDINALETNDWQHLIVGLIMGDKDYRDSIDNGNKPTYQ